MIILLIVLAQEEASNVCLHTLSASYHDGATTTDSWLHSEAMSSNQSYKNRAIDHNYPKQHSIIILVASRESIWNVHDNGHYLASYNYFEHDSCLIVLVKRRTNLLTNA